MATNLPILRPEQHPPGYGASSSMRPPGTPQFSIDRPLRPPGGTPTTPRTPGQQRPASQPARPASSYRPYTPRSARSYSSRPSLSRGSYPGSQSSQHRVRRKYFFTERGEGVDTLPTPKHYDIILEPEDGVEFTADHLCYRYVDFLTLETPSLEYRNGNHAELSEVANWLHKARPRTRLDGYPMFLLARDLLRRMLSKDIKLMHSNENNLRSDLSDAQRRLATADADQKKAVDGCEFAAKAREEALMKELEALKERNRDLEGELARTKQDCAHEKSDLQTLLDDAATDMEALKVQLSSAKELLGESQARESKLQLDLLEAQNIDAAQLATILDSMVNSEAKDHHSNDKMMLFRHLMADCDIEERHEMMHVLMTQGLESVLEVPRVIKDLDEHQQRTALHELTKIMTPQQHMDAITEFCTGHEMAGKATSAMCGLLHEAVKKNADKAEMFEALELSSEFMNELLKKQVASMDAAALEALLGIELGKRISTTAEIETQTETFVLKKAAQAEKAAMVATPGLSRARENGKQTKKKTVLALFEQNHKGHKPEPLRVLLKMIANLYGEKAKADAIDDNNANKRATLYDFLTDFMLNKYGLKSLAIKHTISMILAVRKFSKKHSRDYNIRVATFGEILGVTHTYNDVTQNFMMDFLAAIYGVKEITDNMQHQHPGVPLRDTIKAITRQFALYELASPEGLLDTVKNLEKEFRIADKGTGGLHLEKSYLVPMDELFALILTSWHEASALRTKALVDVFEAFTVNHSPPSEYAHLKEFREIVKRVDSGEVVGLKPISLMDTGGTRSRVDILKMYGEALQSNHGLEHERHGDSEDDGSQAKLLDEEHDGIDLDAFLEIADLHKIGVGLHESHRELLSMAEDEKQAEATFKKKIEMVEAVQTSLPDAVKHEHRKEDAKKSIFR